jgi:hypothetical protein
MSRPRRKGSRPRMGMGMDVRTFAEGMRYPGIDPRQWISYGIVEGKSEDDSTAEVTFDDEYGPLVKVVLQPSMTPVVCRVASQIAGNGEGTYHPFIEGDEVLVAIPEGDETSDCCIIGKLNNSFDKFPSSSIAGQDPSKNGIGFMRTRTPYIVEANGPYLIRSAVTGAMIGIDDGGTATILNGDSSGFQISSDVIGMSNSDGTAMIQLDLTGKHINLRMEDAVLSLSATGANSEVNMISVPGSLVINTTGNAANEHVATTESVVNIIYQIMLALGAVITATGATPLTGTSLGAILIVPATQALGITAAASTPLNPALLAAIMGAFAVMPPKLPTFPAGQTLPGIGCPGLFAG